LVPKEGRVMKVHEAAEEGDVRAIATSSEFNNARDADGWTPLHGASYKDKIEAVRALASLGGGMGETGVGRLLLSSLRRRAT
jgi:ankyrin repeat protein